MRRIATLAFLLLSIMAFGQDASGGFRPDVTIVIREHSMGADMVEVTLSRPDYPVELLRKQLETLGESLGSAPRGLAAGKIQLDKANPDLQFVKAKFAVDGLIDRPAGILRVEPILKTFCGAPDPYTIRSLLILFDGEKPNSRTVSRHTSAGLEAEGTATAEPPMIEYRVRLKSQTPGDLTFPNQVPEQSGPPKTSEKSSGTPVLFIAAIAVAGASAGALVYLALLRGGGGKARR